LLFFQRIVSTFLAIKEVAGGDAQTLTNEVKEILALWELDGQNMVGLGSDGAAVMVLYCISFLTKIFLNVVKYWHFFRLEKTFLWLLSF